jgi:hypothetical protein
VLYEVLADNGGLGSATCFNISQGSSSKLGKMLLLASQLPLLLLLLLLKRALHLLLPPTAAGATNTAHLELSLLKHPELHLEVLAGHQQAPATAVPLPEVHHLCRCGGNGQGAQQQQQ